MHAKLVAAAVLTLLQSGAVRTQDNVRSGGARASQNFFDFVVLPPSVRVAADESDPSAAPIDSLVSERISAAAAAVAGRHPFRSFLMKTDDSGDLFLIGVDRNRRAEKIVFLFDGRSFVKIKEKVEDIFPLIDDPNLKASKNKPNDGGIDLSEFDFWRDHGYLKPHDKSSSNSSSNSNSSNSSSIHGLSELPSTLDFEPELLKDLAEDWPDHVRRNRTKRNSENAPKISTDQEESADMEADVLINEEDDNVSFDESEETENSERSGRDLVYEAMKMRTGFTESRDKDAIRPVGGGLFEKRLLGDVVIDDDASGENGDARINDGASILSADGRRQETFLLHPQMAASLLRMESREMQCCHDLELTSNGGVKECHPYALGRYRKIGGCAGRSFYQHTNNTDIFLYYACGGWYVGLEIGSCGGWMVAKSLELCASGKHQTSWTYFDGGMAKEDSTFGIQERCQFYNDFRPISHPPPQNNHPFRPPNHVINYPNQPVYRPQTTPPPSQHNSEDKQSVKHEHFHYHIKVDGEEKGKSPYKTYPTELPHSLQHRVGSTHGGKFVLPYNNVDDALVRPGDQAVSFQLHGDQVTLAHDSFDGPININKIAGKLPHRNSANALSSDAEDQKQNIMINNFHLPPSGKKTVQAPTSTTTTTTPEPYNFVMVQRPSSDLQQYQQQPIGLREKINQDLITLKYASPGPSDYQEPSVPASQNTPLVGYIIKKRRPVATTPLPSEIYSFYGRSNDRQTEELEQEEDENEEEEIEEKQRTYFPNK